MFGRKKNTRQSTNARQTRIPVQRSGNKDFISYHTVSNRDRENSSTRLRASSDISGKSRLTVQHIPMIFAVVCLMVSALYVSSLQPQVVLRSEKNSKLLRAESEYRDFSAKVLSSSITNKSKILFDSTKFEQEMKQEFPELALVSVSIPLIGHKPIVDLYAEKPVLLMASERGVFVLNKNGRAIVKASAEQPVEGLTIPLVRDEASIPIELGKGALTSQEVAFITTLVSQFENKKIAIDSLTLPPLASELRVKLKDEKYYIKFSLLTDSRIVSGQYFAARKKFDSESITPSEYVDSRVEEKIFFR